MDVMNLDEWVAIVKSFGPTEFKRVAVEFLREHYGCIVQYTDGTGNGGVDAWVVVSEEPRLRRAAQFYAGAGDWEKKLTEDVQKVAELRASLTDRRADLDQLLFVTAQTPAPTNFEIVAEELRSKHDVFVRLFDARAIASLALQRRAGLLDLLAERLPGWSPRAGRGPDEVEQTLIAFSLFHGAPGKYRWAVAKSGLATVLQRSSAVTPEKLKSETAELLGIRSDSSLLGHALRNLIHEELAILDDASGNVLASPVLVARTQTNLRIARAEQDALRDRCADALAPLFPKGVHGRENRARELAESVLRDLGAMVRGAVTQRALRAADEVEPSQRIQTVVAKKVEAIESRLADALDRDATKQAMKVLVAIAANDPFAKRLAAADLFARITEHDVSELQSALRQETLRVFLDASIAMPVLCACYDQVATSWWTSASAHALYLALRARASALLVPSVYVEEIAGHLLKAFTYALAVDGDAELERSENFFVAHYCSTRSGDARTESEFRDFLKAFGGSAAATSTIRQVQREVTRVLTKYGIQVEEISGGDDPPLRDEPVRAELLLRHDRAVVRSLRAKGTEDVLLCTADAWLQERLVEHGMTGVDSAALADLLELVRPFGAHRPLVTPIVLASTLAEEEMKEAARVWDVIVDIEGERLDWKLVERARAFRDQWRKRNRSLDSHDRLRAEWEKFRAHAVR